jgi:hypothetical protein
MFVTNNIKFSIALSWNINYTSFITYPDYEFTTTIPLIYYDYQIYNDLKGQDLQLNLRSSHAKPSIIIRFINDTLNNIIIISNIDLK